MMRLFFTSALLLFLNFSAFSQVTLFSENFEAGAGVTSFTLNTTDVSSVTDATGYNKWIINNAYAGGAGTLFCFVNINYAIANTAAQPSAITNFPNSYYLHVLSDEAQSDGIFCGSYLAADGFCNFAQSHFARMTNDFSTVGYNNVTLSFYWLCGGSSNGYGQVYYSTDAGTTWAQLGSNYFGNASTWTLSTLNNPALNNQPTLRFGFRFANNQTTSGADPGFCVDQVLVQGTVLPTITTGNPNTLTYCAGDAFTLGFSITGVYNVGNQFDAQLSDASGSFASPTVIGSLVSTTAGTITGTIPLATPVGTGYRMRVVATNPATTGTVSTTNITINSQPDAGVMHISDTQVCAGDSTDLALIGASGNGQFQSSVNGIAFTNFGTPGMSMFTGPLSSTRYYRAIVTTSCGSDTTNVVQVTVDQPAIAGTLTAVPDSICAGDSFTVTQVGSSGNWNWEFAPDGISFSMVQTGGNSVTITTPGLLNVVQLVSTNGVCPADTASVTVTVVPAPVAGFTFSQTGNSFTFTNTTVGASTYQWNFGDAGTSTLTSPTHLYTSSGTYIVTLIAVNSIGCADTVTDTITLLSTTDWTFGGVHVYPMPFAGECTVETSTGWNAFTRISLVDVSGREVAQLWSGSGLYGRLCLSVPAIAPGIYLMQVQAGEQIWRSRVVKE